jgi:RNA polymerase sigma-70 factor (ECF subfamily)
MDALLELLTADAAFVGDGGGKAQAFPEPLAGRERIARVMVGLFRRGAALGAGMRPAEVNGMPGLVTFDPEGRVVNVFSLEIADGRVQTVRSVVNPDKLGHLGPVSDLARLPQSGGDTPPG